MFEGEIVCRLDEIEVEFRPNQKQNFTTLLAGARQVNELSDGYEFVLDADHLVRLSEIIARERRCCAFFRFVVLLDPGAETLRLQLSGGEGVKAFIEQEHKKPPQI